MIVWLNGTFGSGKTATSAELLRLIPSSRVFDPETVGDMLRLNLADHPVTDFQQWPPWRRLVVATAIELTGFTGQHLIAPQTVLDHGYLDQMFGGLRAAGLMVFHVVLDADEETLRRRIHDSAEARQWRLDHLPAYQQSRPWMIQAADLVVDTGQHTPAEAAQQIAAALPEAVDAEAMAGGRAAMISRIQNARFGTTRRGGYDERQVDEFLDLLAGILGGERPLDPLMVRSASFEITRLRPGYTKADVDVLLDEIARYASGYK